MIKVNTAMVTGVAAALALSLLGAPAPSRGERADPPEEEDAALASLEAEQEGLFVQVAPSVVLLSGGGASGSGFVVARGLVLTNSHVVGSSEEVSVQLLDGRSGRGRVVGRATGALDLALVETPFRDLPPLAPGDPAAVRAGMFAATVGHGGGAAWTFSTGLIANPRPLGDGAPMLLAQMALRPGSSGGPLVDRRGRVMAVVTAGTRDASGVTFAIRIDAATAAYPQLAGQAARTARPVAAAATSSAVGGEAVDVERLSQASPDPRSGGMVVVWEAPPVARRTSRVPTVRSPPPAPASGVVLEALAAIWRSATVERELARPPPAPTLADRGEPPLR